MKQTIINGERPPNYPDIVAVLPQARRPTVIFSYGDKIYNPGSGDISVHLIAHEAVHGERQIDQGVQLWWHMYLNDVRFRYNEELLAHRAEYLSMLGNNPNRQHRRGALKLVAGRLCSPLYGRPGSWKKTAEHIVKGI